MQPWHAGDSRRASVTTRPGATGSRTTPSSEAFAASGDPALQYSVGIALYRLQRYEEAARSFRDATSVPGSGSRATTIWAMPTSGRPRRPPNKDELLRQAIAAYEEALRLSPADSAAKWNLELALQRRGEDRESGGSSGRGRSADYGRGNMNVPGYEGNPEAAVGAMAGGGYGVGRGRVGRRAERERRPGQLLEAVEREQLSSHQGRQSSAEAEQAQKDW